MYGQLSRDSSRAYSSYSSEGGYNDSGYGSYGHGDNYRGYRPRDSLKGKIEQKYWKTKQKVIEKLDKRQDEFVVAGDADVDARLEAFRHIQSTCSQLMFAVELYQNRIFALSQDENEMGRFLRDQGSSDKTKAGKMMISVGKAQSYAAQQRLSLRIPLVRLYQEVETFRCRAVSDTMMTVERMEESRSNYRAGLLWMADISKELDPDVNKRLDKFREVQIQVKENKRIFEKLKGDVVQKIDLLSASRCNLLSATLAAYQQAMIKFLEQSTKTYQSVYEQFKGHPSYQFQILKHIIPNNGIADDDEDLKPSRRKPKIVEQAQEAKEDAAKNDPENGEKDEADDDDKLILFDNSPAEEQVEVSEFQQQHQQLQQQQQRQQLEQMNGNQETDLLGILDNTDAGRQPTNGIFGEFESSSNGMKEKQGNGEFEDLLGGMGTNLSAQDNRDPMSLLSSTTDLLNQYQSLKSVPGGDGLRQLQDQSSAAPSIDELLFGISSSEGGKREGGKSDIDILGDILGSSSLGNEPENESSFSSQWQKMFGSNIGATATETPKENPDPTEAATAGGSAFMPSFLMEQLRQADPQAAMQGAPPGFSAVSETGSTGPPPPKGKGKENKSKKGKDMSAWFNLFSDLDPLANPDAIGKETGAEQERSC